MALIATPALAQNAQANAQADDQPASGIADIVVTANRTESLASKTPIALTAVSGEALVSQGITNPTALAETVPNLSIDRANGLQITIRGVTSTDGTEKGDPSAAFMLDGVYIARPQVQEVSFFDIGRVEVLRGPQGTLYGRNTTAGVVNVLSAKPKLGEFGGSLDLTYGNYDTLQATGVLNVPVSETIALRAAVNYDRRDSYLRAGTGFTTKLSPFKDNLSFRGSALFDLGGGELVIRGDYSNIDGQNINSLPLTNVYSNVTTNFVNPTYIGGDKSSGALRTLNVPSNFDAARNNNTWGVMADFSYDLGPVSVNYLGSYREFERHEDGINIRSLGARAIATRFDGGYWQQSHELRFSTNGDGPLKAQVGGYYFQEKSGIGFYLLGLLSPTPNTTGYVFGFPQDPTKAKSYAGFAQATYSATDALRFTAGIRYSHDDKSRVGNTVTCSTVACNLPTDTKSNNNAARSFSKTTWRVGLDFDASDTTLLYATVSTGYKAGGFNDGCNTAENASCNQNRTLGALYYEPETLTSYEAGIKTRIGDSVRLNLSGFHYDYKNLQVSQVATCTPGGGQCQVTTNAATAKVDGIEMEANIQASENDRFDMAVAWLDARYGTFAPSLIVSGATVVQNWEGYALDRSPRWTVNLGYTRTFDLGSVGSLQAQVRTRISTAYKLAGLANVQQLTQPGFSKTDANLTYNEPNEKWYVQAFVKNLENNVTVSSIAPGANGTVQLADPLTYGMRAGFKF
ncbi:TonB-dependent receptor [Novosphingobium sp. SL115]|uniref:TonB-dependent receptor n=1 Tax=Novosphingobium sp. SL115 TaxID=2995150 RepID=UPI002276D631|nr:TonB-dependent receptor [Novosphingobium sp. SL115]MCY1672772.1 TonB-dependent receptor [Novosphingobium sp. SL115]